MEHKHVHSKSQKQNEHLGFAMETMGTKEKHTFCVGT